MNSLSTFLHTPGSYSNVFYDASLYESGVPTPPESGEQPRVTRRGRKPGRRRVYSVPSEVLHRRLETLFHGGRRGKLCETAKGVARRCGRHYSGAGLFVEAEEIASSGVQKRQFRRHLAELAPTFKTKRSGQMLHVWCRELAEDQAWGKSADELLAGLYELESQGYLFLAEARGFYENLMGARKYDKRGPIRKLGVPPGTKSWSSPTLEKPGFRDFKTRDLKLRIPEEEIPRPEGGLSWERRGSLSERDFNPEPSRLSGSARSAPAGTSPTASPADARAPAGGIFEFLDETGEQERPAGCTALLRTLLPPLPSGPVLPRPDTETRIQGMAATQVQSLRPARVLDDSEDQEGTVTQRNGQPVGPAVRKAGGITMSALWGAYHRLMYRLLPTYLPTCSPDLRRRDGAALERIGRRYCAGESLEWLEEWLARNLTLYVKDVRRDGHPPRGFEAWLNRRVEGEAWVPDILSMLSN